MCEKVHQRRLPRSAGAEDGQETSRLRAAGDVEEDLLDVRLTLQLRAFLVGCEATDGFPCQSDGRGVLWKGIKIPHFL